MPDSSGSFLIASNIISENSGRIVRVNYNKAVDVHTLFVEVDASKEAHAVIAGKLKEKGYISGLFENMQVIMVLVRTDRKASINPVLEIINRYNVNITYINFTETDAPKQEFRLGLISDRSGELKEMIDEISTVTEIRILDYKVTDGLLDGTVFYLSFANEMREILGLSQDNVNKLIIEANKLMQIMDGEKKFPIQTFDYIRRFAEFVKNRKGGGFNARINSYRLDKDITLLSVEPPCGSNSYIIEYGDELLFVDCGLACYRMEMENILYQYFPDYEKRKKTLLLTHGDVDHTGLHAMFDKIYMNRDCYENFVYQVKGKPDFREQNTRHNPFCVLMKMISGYIPPELDKCVVIGEKKDKEMLSYIGTLEFAGKKFEFYEGNGGHVKGDTVIVCPELKLIFTGDIYVNIKGFSYEQKEFNSLAPFLMSGVDTLPAEALRLRTYIREKYKGYITCPGHGSVQL